MLSASNMPLPQSHHDHPKCAEPTTVLLLPALTIIENVTPQSVPDLIDHYISMASTNTTPLPKAPSETTQNTPTATSEITAAGLLDPAETSAPSLSLPPPSKFTSRPCPHNYLILLCSQKTRDARCGQSAPLLRREFERHLRPLGLYRDLHDERPGGVGIYFISHVGGHKFSANLMIYRRAGVDSGEKVVSGEAAQCIWIARVRPEDCEGIVKFTIMQGKVVKPERQLRGGFDRERGLVSW